MNYSEVVGIHPFFQDVFDMLAEPKDYWKTFITNDQFENNLNRVLDSLDEKKKSVWVQGTYGTGKSHSTSVVKHLLCDELGEIKPYLSQIKDVQIRTRLLSFREKKTCFPVVLKGVNSILDVLDLNFVIQNAVKNAFEQRNITLATKTDFDLMIDKLNDSKFAGYWNNVLSINEEISQSAASISELIDKLKQNNVKILKLLKNQFKSDNLVAFNSSVQQWLVEALEVLKQNKIADNLIIFWDEFTAVLDTGERIALFNEIQNIAELSKQGVLLYLINHKKIEAIASFKELRENEKNMAKARFEPITLDMQPYTAYHIISGAILKKDETEWERLRKQNVDQNIALLEIVNKLAEENVIREKIKEIYPLHPYTSYLATFVSRVIGSAERSIFKFLNDEKGFKQFLQLDTENVNFLTADYLWDFFLNDFEDDTGNKFDSVLSKYKLNIDQIKQQGDVYVVVFKIILLLNVLYKLTMTNEIIDESSLAIPSVENIRNTLSGVYSVAEINNVLQYIEDNQVIHKTPEGLFEVAFTTLPPKQIIEAKNNEYIKYEDITKLLSLYPVEQNKIIQQLKRQIKRETEIKFFWGGDTEHNLRNRIATAFAKPYALSIAVLLFRGETKNLDDTIKRQERSLTSTIDIIRSLSSQPGFENTIFVLVKELFGNKRFEGYVDSIASSIVAKAHGFGSEESQYLDRAGKWLGDWIKAIDTGNASVIFRNNSIEKPINLLSYYFQNDVVGIIFNHGLEKVCSESTVWKTTFGTGAAEAVLFSDSRDDLETRLKGNLQYLKRMLKNSAGDYVVADDLEFREGITVEHSLYDVSEYVNKLIGTASSESIVHLGKVLQDLNKAPYGVYHNYVGIAVLSFALRKYINKLYKEGTGKIIDKSVMRDTVMSIFNYWEKEKDENELLVRSTTDEERELVNLIQTLFNLDPTTVGLVKTKWVMRDKFKASHNCPLWTLKYFGPGNDTLNLALDKLFSFANARDNEIQSDTIDELLILLKNNATDISSRLGGIREDQALNQYLLQIPDSNLQESELQSLIEYLESNMQENKAFWSEADVNSFVWKWIAVERNREENRENEGSGNTGETGGLGGSTGTFAGNPGGWRGGTGTFGGGTGGGDTGTGGFGGETRESNDGTNRNEGGQSAGNEGTDTSVSPERKQKMKRSIEQFSGDVSEVKKVLLLLLDEHPEVVKYLEKYFR